MRQFFVSVPLLVFLRVRNSRFKALGKIFSSVQFRDDVEPTVRVLAIDHREATNNVKASELLPPSSQSIVNVADRLHDQGDPERTYLYLKQFADLDDPEILWRYGRSCAYVYQLLVARDEQIHEQRKVVDEGLKAAQRAVDLNGDNSHCIHVSLYTTPRIQK